MYAIIVECENWNNEKFNLISKKKWASYEDARKNLENYIETIPEENIVTDYYVREEDS